MLLYSINTYLQNKDEISEKQFTRRIRILRNLIWNSQDEIREDRMRNLLSESKKIITTGIIPVSEKGDLGYNVNQKNEEVNTPMLIFFRIKFEKLLLIFLFFVALIISK